MPQTVSSASVVDTKDANDPLWYKDAVIYQLHVKAFFDASGDGTGDFAGLASKLDYLCSLGVTAIWLLPFYPSPLRDDGYDIADYRDINPRYGTMAQFRIFVREAHKRGLRVITELVINHTSDQHPWFQRARLAKPGSVHRNYYVWSDDDKKWPETRIIFLDTETSNWAWDPVAKQYYWHRFFSHQPDLNFDNPRVIEEILRVMKFWLDCGVDGMRLDAVPYLVERDGTNNENLPESHNVIKTLRAWMDKHYTGRMLLAEANQWPEDVLPYFGEGEGDECNMAFHFPLMPRMYMALAQEDRLPITDIMRQTPDIPATSQWAVFLRNHDELTLEMVTDRERDYLWNYYAAEPRARINLGIRRRLASLVDNDRRKIELLNSLLMSMPGTPIIYYGDEVGMGDNIYLGDRDAVRTPMQWSPDRNGGFSRADPQRLFLPPVMDPIYGFEAVNVEAQQGNPSSLLNWMRRIITVRKQHQAFGRGQLRFLYPGNRKILAFLREFEGETILCVANLSRAAQPVELDLSEFAGHVPVELMGRSAFPPIGDLPYFVTLPAFGFYWFLLAEANEAPHWYEGWRTPLPEFVTVVMSKGWPSLLSGSGQHALDNQALPEYLPNQRWYGGKGGKVSHVERTSAALLDSPDGTWMLGTWDATARGEKKPRHVFLPVATAWESHEDDPLTRLSSFTIARARRSAHVGVIYDASANPDFAKALARAILEGREIKGHDGSAYRMTPTVTGQDVTFDADTTATRLGQEQSNTSIRIGDDLIIKLLRRLEPGLHPEVEMGRHLTDVANFPNIPPLYGHAEVVLADGTTAAVAVLQGFVHNQGDGWQYTVDYLDRFLEGIEMQLNNGQVVDEEGLVQHGFFRILARTLGTRVAELHQALALPTDNPAFAPEPVTEHDLGQWRTRLHAQAAAAREALEIARSSQTGSAANDIEALLANWSRVDSLIESYLGGHPAILKTRYHGDLHLGQVVLVRDDFYLLDFEGEPSRSLAERREKHSALRDVAGMLRSFDYAAWQALFRCESIIPGALDRLRPWATDWQTAAHEAFLEGYGAIMAGHGSLPADPDEARHLTAAFVLEKALYEIVYEADHRPDWLRIPVLGVLALLQDDQIPAPPSDA